MDSSPKAALPLTLSVYGATGFVGQNFCAASKFPTHAIARETRKPVSADIVYCISTTHNYNVFTDLQIDIRTNLSVLMETLQEFKDSKGVFNFLSSWFVYGDTELPARELGPCHPKGFYSITKRTAEQLLISFCETFGLKYRILRLANVYGADDKANAQKNALQFLIGELKENRDIALYHEGKFFRDYIHVSDVVRAIDLCVDKAPVNQIINIGSGHKYVFADLISHAHRVSGSKSQVGTKAPPDFHKTVQVKDFFMDTSALQQLGFKPEKDIYEELTKLCRAKKS